MYWAIKHQCAMGTSLTKVVKFVVVWYSLFLVVCFGIGAFVALQPMRLVVASCNCLVVEDLTATLENSSYVLLFGC